MLTLGIQFGSHDTSASLARDGEILAVMEQERFNHDKHTLAFPIDAIKYCLEAGDVSLGDLDYVCYAGDAELTNAQKEKFIKAGLSESFVPHMSDQDAYEKNLRARLEEISPAAQTVKFYSVDHHKAHAASAFYTAPFEEAAIFTVDGMGNWLTTTLSCGRNKNIIGIDEISHPHSLGLVYGAVTQYLGFQAACDESKVMGLASYGDPEYLADFREIIKYEDKTIKLDLNYFTFHNQPLIDEHGKFNTWFSQAFVDRFGPVRDPESELTQRAMDMAQSVQAILEERCFQLLNDLYDKTKVDNLCLAGGVALNSSMNGKIIDFTPFKRVFIVPAANDAGLSLGAALQCNADRSSKFQPVPIKHAYYGSSYSATDIEAEFLNLPEKIEVKRYEEGQLIEAAAEMLGAYEIVGWYQDRMEFGPRALGNRSILANPTKAETKDIVNQKVKFRENFRPFAPMIPEEYVMDYFEAKQDMPFMLKIVQVQKEARAKIPAVTHVDNTARVQTVREDQNRKIYKLLHAMKERWGTPVLLNTSFNIRGDTIVRTPYDAINCFLKTGMNSLVIGPYVLRKHSSDIYSWKNEETVQQIG